MSKPSLHNESVKKINTVSKIIFGLVNFAAFGTAAFAQDTGSGTTSFSVTNLTVQGQNVGAVIGEGKHPVASLIVRVINFLSLSIGSVAFLAIIIGGIMLLASGGKETQVTKGKDIIRDAIIGLVVAFCAYFITSYVQSIFYEYAPAAQ